MTDPAGVGPRLLFQKVPEGKTAKNRVHLDVDPAPGVVGEERRAAVRAHAERLVAAGGSVRREVDEVTGWCLMMADPEGNEFCVH